MVSLERIAWRRARRHVPYRRLALTILGLDVASLAADLTSARRATLTRAA
jgi:hypothetical protein